jgi:hypothetical protein
MIHTRCWTVSIKMTLIMAIRGRRQVQSCRMMSCGVWMLSWLLSRATIVNAWFSPSLLLQGVYFVGTILILAGF